MKSLLSLLPSLVAIVICASLGSFIAHVIVDLFSWQATVAAIATVLLSMLLAFALFVAAVALSTLFARKK